MLSNASMVMLLAKATIILVTALGITVVMQRASAGARHLVWLVTLGTLLMVPALAAWSPLRIEVLPPVVESSAATTVERESLGPAAASGPTATAAATELPAAQYSAPESIASRLSSLASLRGLYLLVGIWAAVVLALAAWLAWSAFAVRRIVRRSHPLDTQDWMTPLWEIADRLELDEPPRLLGSDEAKMPFACGFIRSTIVLPANCETWTPDRRRAVLLHELAHVKRHDLVGHTLGRLTCALYWFHPLVWTAARRLRSESERACDDLALSCGAKASDYAEHLLDIVTSVRGDSTPAVALAMARRKEFEGRMLAILDPELRRSRPGRGQSAALIVSLALIAIVVGAAAPAPRPGSPITLASQVAAAPASAGAVEQFAPKDEIESFPAEPHQTAAAAVEKAAASLLEEKGDDRGKVLSVEAQASAMIDAIAGTVASSVADAVTSSVGSVASKTSASVIEKLGAGFKEVATAPADERPALLANILRTDKDPSLRRIAAWGLSEHARHTVAIEALALAVRRDADPGVREMAAWALRDSRRNSAGVVALSEALRSDQSEKVRATAAWSLGNIGDPDAVGSITAALSDEARSVRHRAVWAIGRVEPKQAPPALVTLLRDPEPAIRRVTAWALYRIEDSSTAGALNAALQAETNQNLRMDYIRALAALGEKSVEAVRGLLTSSDPQVRQMAVRALAGGHAAGPWPWPWPEPRPYP